MSFQSYKIFSPEEITTIINSRNYGSKLPSSLQIGDRAKLWVWNTDDHGNANDHKAPIALPCLILRVNFGTVYPGNGITYTVGFEIGNGSGWFAAVEGVRGNITPPEVMEFDHQRDSLVELDSKLMTTLRRSMIRSVPVGETADIERCNPPLAELTEGENAHFENLYKESIQSGFVGSFQEWYEINARRPAPPAKEVPKPELKLVALSLPDLDLTSPQS